MSDRSSDVQAFVNSVRAGYEASGMDADTRRCISDVFAALDASVGERNEGSRRYRVSSSLPRAMEVARSAGPVWASIGTAFAALESRIAWTRRPGGPGASENIMDGHANAMVVGPGGLENRDDVQVGLSLLAPNVRYPDHRHAPEETYLALTPGEFMHGESDWFSPGIGGSFYNPPNILHAMRSGETPLLAIWCLRRVED